MEKYPKFNSLLLFALICVIFYLVYVIILKLERRNRRRHSAPNDPANKGFKWQTAKGFLFAFKITKIKDDELNISVYGPYCPKHRIPMNPELWKGLFYAYHWVCPECGETKGSNKRISKLKKMGRWAVVKRLVQGTLH